MAIQDFTRTVAVVAGGASGIGLATALAIYKQGAHVVLADINEEGLQRAAERVREAASDSAARIATVVTDVTDDAQTQGLMREARGLSGRLDLVVACAGIGRGGRIEDLPSAEMRKMMDINFLGIYGIYNCVQAALPTMREQGSGHFALISLVPGKLGSRCSQGTAPANGLYVASRSR